MAKQGKKKINKGAVKSKKATKGAKPKVKRSGTKGKAQKKGVYTVYLGLGSNVGDREEYIEQAVFLLEKNPVIEVTKRSTNYETAAEGTADQPPYINAVVQIKTKLGPHLLLEVCHEIEATLGREREVEWGPRTCDIDILLYDGLVVSDDKVQVPHPLMHERLFVLKPLREITPNLVHPILEKTIDALYDERKVEQGETYDDEIPGFKEIKGATFDDYERW
ncbi:2-amino-4-hydroxy-6-hydroxymethyldihydropteridine diphosphokinase [Candidatus Saganbacteria bacterium CG08_land_8_20_14_0_20_45_16]|uniref:2-amino-4-hydroxy-6-hydroxymethyldihydropteridine diphosphokinase n=1 Tax=Candidatus Saganbacteria bacterium CG08_land_8_20_14_0_20_45_16 TaxID=2014293 RepID=A0A2H0XZW7_UNCSA|nr:MAG: 2-amino-4-hydroxy-6-hydroxymethyldihydropteridine diphosphokinase [Candidatus Saganbacteria bacterium CG08_land_8_20_14_0_20_45_16]